MVFTVATVIFVSRVLPFNLRDMPGSPGSQLPLSFMTSLFGMNNRELSINSGASTENSDTSSSSIKAWDLVIRDFMPVTFIGQLKVLGLSFRVFSQFLSISFSLFLLSCSLFFLSLY